jgi:hypothetical protein
MTRWQRRHHNGRDQRGAATEDVEAEGEARLGRGEVEYGDVWHRMRRVAW